MAPKPVASGGGRKKSLEALRWLSAFYAHRENEDEITPNLPENIVFNHPSEDVARMMNLLTLSDFHWTPQQILDMPAGWADDILNAHAYGEIIDKQTRKKVPGQ